MITSAEKQSYGGKRVPRKIARSIGIAMLLFLLLAAVALAVSINWGAATNPIYDESGIGGTLLEDGDIVQLIWDADQDGIDPPDSDGLPQGGDQLLDTSSIGTGAFPNTGRFSDNLNTNLVGPGYNIYARAWNANTLGNATHYGESPMATVTSDVSFTFDCTASGSFATLDLLPPSCIEGDVDCNCQVDVFDLSLVASSWLATLGDPNYVTARDVNHDSKIDILDLLYVSARFGNACV